MDNIQVKIVRTQSFQRFVYFAANRFSRKMPLIEIDLGRYHDFITGNIVFYRPAKVFLASAHGIAVRRIEKVDTQIECVFDNDLALLGIQSPCVHLACGIPEAHASEAKTGNLYPAVSEFCVFHKILLMIIRIFFDRQNRSHGVR